jgi:hypothetical protein
VETIKPNRAPRPEFDSQAQILAMFETRMERVEGVEVWKGYLGIQLVAMSLSEAGLRRLLLKYVATM